MNTQIDTEDAKRAVAKHSLLAKSDDGSVAVVENYEDANGIRYVSIANGVTIDYFPMVKGAIMPIGEGGTMLALFGGRTLATNEASGIRNSKEGKAGQTSPDDETNAIQDRLGLVDTGTWVDRSREGVGQKLDLPKLATAGVNVLTAGGHANVAKYDEILRRLTEEKGFVTTLRGIPGVTEEYAKLVGRTTKSVADLAAMLGPQS